MFNVLRDVEEGLANLKNGLRNQTKEVGFEVLSKQRQNILFAAIRSVAMAERHLGRAANQMDEFDARNNVCASKSPIQNNKIPKIPQRIAENLAASSPAARLVAENFANLSEQDQELLQKVAVFSERSWQMLFGSGIKPTSQKMCDKLWKLPEAAQAPYLAFRNTSDESKQFFKSFYALSIQERKIVAAWWKLSARANIPTLRTK